MGENILLCVLLHSRDLSDCNSCDDSRRENRADPDDAASCVVCFRYPVHIPVFAYRCCSDHKRNRSNNPSRSVRRSGGQWFDNNMRRSLWLYRGFDDITGRKNNLFNHAQHRSCSAGFPFSLGFCGARCFQKQARFPRACFWFVLALPLRPFPRCAGPRRHTNLYRRSAAPVRRLRTA